MAKTATTPSAIDIILAALAAHEEATATPAKATPAKATPARKAATRKAAAPKATPATEKVSVRKAPAETGIDALDRLSADRYAKKQAEAPARKAQAETRAARSAANKAAWAEKRQQEVAARAHMYVTEPQIDLLLSLARQLAHLGRKKEAMFLTDVVSSAADLTRGEVSPIISDAIAMVKEVKAAAKK